MVFSFTPHGREGIGVIQPQSGLDYPLVNPSDDIRYLLADFYLSYDDRGEYSPTVLPTQFPLRIKYLLNIGSEPNDLPAGAPVPAHDADIVIVDSRGTEILNTATVAATFSQRDWGNDYRIYEWITPDATCRLVAYTTWKTGEPEPKEYAQHLEPAAAVLDARTIHKLPKRLRSLRVRQRNGTTTAGPYTGNITFKNGYNTELAAGETTATNFLVNTRVTLNATAGSGLGYYSECGDNYDQENNTIVPQAIRTINGVNARTAGDFLLSAGDCLYIRRPTPSGQQQIGADCSSSCSCDDYVDTALYMNELRDQYSVIGERVTTVKSIHAENIAKWSAARACSLNPLKLILAPQCCPAMDVVAMLCNPCAECYQPSKLTVSFDQPVELVCGGTTLFKPDGSTANTGIAAAGSSFTVDMPAVKPGGSTYVKFRVKAPEPTTAPIRGTLTGVFIDGAPIKTGCAGETPDDSRTAASAQVQVVFNCDSDGGDTRPCAIT